MEWHPNRLFFDGTPGKITEIASLLQAYHLAKQYEFRGLEAASFEMLHSLDQVLLRKETV